MAWIFDTYDVTHTGQNNLAHEGGGRVIGLSDSSGAIASAAGLDPGAVLAHERATGTVLGYPGASEIPAADLLEMDCDVLIPAALENQITAANGPTTPTADDLLFKRGVQVVPDILASGGGVTVSCYERRGGEIRRRQDGRLSAGAGQGCPGDRDARHLAVRYGLENAAPGRQCRPGAAGRGGGQSADVDPPQVSHVR